MLLHTIIIRRTKLQYTPGANKILHNIEICTIITIGIGILDSSIL